MSRSSAPKVTMMMDSADWMVSRTEDVALARELVYAELRNDDPLEDEAEHRAQVERLDARVGWYRWTPCHPSSCYDGGGHSGHLGYTNRPGRGVFRGVFLTGGW